MKKILYFVEIILLASFAWFILGRCSVGIYIDKKRNKAVIADCPSESACESDKVIGRYNCLTILLLSIKVPPKDQNITQEERAAIDKQNYELGFLYKLCHDEARKKDTTPNR